MREINLNENHNKVIMRQIIKFGSESKLTDINTGNDFNLALYTINCFVVSVDDLLVHFRKFYEFS